MQQAIDLEESPIVEGLDTIFERQKLKSAQIRAEHINQRKARLKKLRSWILDHRQDIQQAVFKDFKKPDVEADLTETYVVLSEINHAIKNLGRWARPKSVVAPLIFIGTSSQVFPEPKGVCLIISPWNFPFNLTVGPLVSALAAGNTAIIKPSELSPNTSALIQEMVSELFEPELVKVFQGDERVARELLKLPFDHIFFTGSPRVGKIVMAAASRHLSSVTLELGGKSPLIVHCTANLDDMAKKTAWGKFINAGQTCIAPDYVLVPKSLEALLISKLKGQIEMLFSSKTKSFEASPDYARLINRNHFQRIQHLVDDAVKRGARLDMGGIGKEEDRFFPPTLVSNLKPDMLLLQEEIFGPVLPIATYDKESEVIDIVNARPRPLALYIFARSKQFTQRIRNSCSAGTSCINETVIHFLHPNIPFGGVNNSGIGKAHGHQGFLAFSNQKPILKQKTGLTALSVLYPPYTKTVRKLVNLLLKYF